MDINADVKSISKLSDYFFIVPDYQREYVWKPDDQVEQFIIDIDNEFDANAKEQSGYFIGSIIIVENNGKFDVIDGQQRLTTIILALCAFRDLLKDQGLDGKQKNILKAIEELLSNYDINSDETMLRLELQYDESKGYLKSLIHYEEYKDERTPSIERMEQAYVRLKEHFEGYLKESTEKLTAFARYFLTKIELVVIESENLSSALKIFETINQRGVGLNAMDLVKNLLFSQAREADFQKIKDTWKVITSNLQACGEDSKPLRFLRYFLMSRYYHGVIREDDIYKWIISPDGKVATSYETNPLDFAKELQKVSKRYSDLVRATEFLKDGGNYPSVTNIGFINKYKSRQHLILLLALDTSCGDAEIEYLGQQVESFFFFSNTMKIQAKNNERLFAVWSGKLRGAKTIDEIRNVLSTTMLPYLKDRIGQFKSDFLNIYHGSYNPLYRVRYVLGRIENTLRKESGLPEKGQDFFYRLQIEHILPQTPKNGHLPAEFADPSEYYGTIHKLGNVVLLEGVINGAVSKFNDLTGDWFQQKQGEYQKSDLLTACLLNHNYAIGKNTGINKVKEKYQHSFDSWSKQTIKDRQRILLELALETWKINGERIDK